MPTKIEETSVFTEISITQLRGRVYRLRDCEVMLDKDLAQLYAMEVKYLKRAVRRNLERFPEDFVFEVTKEEAKKLWCQLGTLGGGLHGDVNVRCQTSTLASMSSHYRYMPFAFTEQGVAMLSSVLDNSRATQVNILIMRMLAMLRRESLNPKPHSDARFQALENRVSQLERNRDGSEVVASLKLEEARKSPAFNHFHADRVTEIQNTVARYWGVRPDVLKSLSRARSATLPRHIAIFLMRTRLGLSFAEIGAYFGGRDHTTILYAYRRMCVESECDKRIKTAITNLQKTLQSYQKL